MQHFVTIDIEKLLSVAKANGLNQRDLCRKAGVNRCIIHRIRKGKSRTKLSTIQKLIEAANV